MQIENGNVIENDTDDEHDEKNKKIEFLYETINIERLKGVNKYLHCIRNLNRLSIEMMQEIYLLSSYEKMIIIKEYNNVVKILLEYIDFFSK